jgi:hypothetical protein
MGAMTDQEKIRGQIRQIRSLIQAGKQRIAALRPVWGAYLAGETMSSLDEAVDDLETELGLSAPAERGTRMPRTG